MTQSAKVKTDLELSRVKITNKRSLKESNNHFELVGFRLVEGSIIEVKFTVNRCRKSGKSLLIRVSGEFELP